MTIRIKVFIKRYGLLYISRNGKFAGTDCEVHDNILSVSYLE